MMRRGIAGLLTALVLVWGASLAASAQLKAPPKKAAPKLMSKTLDINSAPEADLVALGIDKAVAKKIVDGRPYRNKRELVSRQMLTLDQYNKLKDQIVAKQPSGK